MWGDVGVVLLLLGLGALTVLNIVKGYSDYRSGQHRLKLCEAACGERRAPACFAADGVEYAACAGTDGGVEVRRVP